DMKYVTHFDDFFGFRIAFIILPFTDSLSGYLKLKSHLFLGNARFFSQFLNFFTKRHRSASFQYLDDKKAADFTTNIQLLFATSRCNQWLPGVKRGQSPAA